MLLADDQSSDSSVEIIRKYIQKYNLPWKVTINKERKGFGGNFFSLMNQCSGDLIFPSDQDDVWRLDKIERMSEIMEKTPEISVLISEYRLVPSTFSCSDLNKQSVPYFEDYDLWVRMDQKGFFGANLPVTLVYARIGNDMIGRRQGLSYCRHELFFLRRARESGFLSFPEYLAALVVRIPVRLLPKPILALVYKIVRMPPTRLVERVRAILQGGGES